MFGRNSSPRVVLTVVFVLVTVCSLSFLTWHFNRLMRSASALAPRVVAEERQSLQAGSKQAEQREDIILVDKRKVVKKTTKDPWAYICKIVTIFKDGSKAEGSGAMVGPHHCLTAAHNIYDKGHGGWAERVEVIPGYDGTRKDSEGKSAPRPYGSAFNAESGTIAWTEWTEKENPDYDLSLVITDSNIGKKSGYFGIKALSDGELSKVKAHMAGYPGDKDNAERQYYDTGTISRYDSGRVYYKLGTWRGQSGAGLYIREESDDDTEELQPRYVFAVHTTGGKVENSGARITSGLLGTLIKYKQDNFEGLNYPPKYPKE